MIFSLLVSLFFCKGRGTTQAIIKLLSYILPAHHDKIYSACFFLDLRKAFDTIDQRILLQKLERYGFRGQCCVYRKSYYHNKKQLVNLNGHESDMMTVSNGVPQGSILGPLCFILFINDLPISVDVSTVLFADDAAFAVKSSSLTDLYLKINKLFAYLPIYLNNNRLVANSSKSKLMKFSSRPTQNLPDLVFANEVIEWIDEFKYVGLTITNKLSFAKHINYALAFPHLINHAVIWGSACLSRLKILSTRLNNMLRVIFGVRRIDGRPNVHTNEMYKMNSLLKIEYVFKHCLFKLLKQLLDGNLPDMISVLLEPHISPVLMKLGMVCFINRLWCVKWREGLCLIS